MTKTLSAQETPDFHLLFESAPNLNLVLSPDLKIVAVTDAYLRATMTRREDILNRHIFEVFPDNPDDPAATGVDNLRTSLNRVLKERVPDTMAVQRYDIRKPESEGGEFEERFWSPVNSPTFGPDGELTYIVHRVEDVTQFVRDIVQEQNLKRNATAERVDLKGRVAQMEAEVYLRAKEVQESNHRLELANKELESFSYSVSHDLRAPLRGIDGFSLAMLEDYGPLLDATGRDYLERIRAATKRMGLLIDDLLALARIARGELIKEATDLSRIAGNVADELIKASPERKVDVAIAANITAEADPRLLRIAFENLLGNAWKFTSKLPEARIEFGQTQEDGSVVYFVKDNGAGFDHAHAGRLFGAFQRLHSTQEFPGTGIGLATVQRIIHRHGGRIWAEGAVNQGATIYFTLQSISIKS